MKSSFRKRINLNQVQPIATKISSYTSQLLISSGIPSYDDLLGGGIPVGSLTMVKKDSYTTYADLFGKYFISQGLVSNHDILVISADNKPENIVNNLMSVIEGKSATIIENEDEEEENESNIEPKKKGVRFAEEEDKPVIKKKRVMFSDDTVEPSTRKPQSRKSELKIAWRYENLPKFNDKNKDDFVKNSFCSIFDLTKTVDPEFIKSKEENISLVNINEWNQDENILDKLYKEIENKLKSEKFSKDNNTKTKSVLRILIDSFDSPFWNLNSTSSQKYVFLHKLRTLLRNSHAVCLFTIPSYIYNDSRNDYVSNHIRRLEHACDCVIRIDSFEGMANPLSKDIIQDFQGFFHVIKLPCINTLTSGIKMSETTLHNLAFKCRRKKFCIETFNLPPEMEETDQREGGSIIRSCSNGKSKLDF
ncbi:PAXNEB-domain-containing protein [Piromyces finnis]|uniref:Elongator complex protein 4 n=1 Tax=Piromyces finnis TaxID=1754191 RepID=A0A1Y1V7Z0_9FUNG|nr:PAXNEB-domain-containing protein [Piromyces finnis]|eukprot:ORX49288.1 PAXNEB-domain-containing protein [Piromyces finnis]